MRIIRDCMVFDTFDDFYERRLAIRKAFRGASDTYKEVYRLYVFSNRMLTVQKASLIWEYLNEENDSEYYVKNKDLERLYKSKGARK